MSQALVFIFRSLSSGQNMDPKLRSTERQQSWSVWQED